MVLQIISDTNKSLAFEILANGFPKNNLGVYYILIQNKDTEFSKFLAESGVNYSIVYYEKKRNVIGVFFSVCKVIRKIKPSIVHTHLRMASLVGLLAAKVMAVPHRLHTRHHSTLNFDYYPSGVKYDKLINSMSTHIISISSVVSNVLVTREGVNPKKISVIHHGLNLNEFIDVPKERVGALKAKYGINNISGPIVGVISRYIELKGIQYIVPAFEKYKKEFPNAHLILANAIGDYSTEIQTILRSSLKPTDYTEIKFENDLYAFYQLFDYFIHVPVSKDVEAFGQTYIECLASGVPSIVTLSGIANEIIIDDFNAIVVPYCSSNAIFEALIELKEKKEKRLRLVRNGIESVQEFSADKYVQNHINLYQKLCHQNVKS